MNGVQFLEEAEVYKMKSYFLKTWTENGPQVEEVLEYKTLIQIVSDLSREGKRFVVYEAECILDNS